MKLRAGVFSVIIAGISALGGLCGQSLAAELPESHKGGCGPRTIHRTYIRRDVVEPGVYEVRRVPAQYGWVVSGGGEPRRILLRPYKNITHFEPPSVAWYREHLTIVPEPDC